MDVNEMDESLKRLGVSRHEAAHVAAAVLLEEPVWAVYRDATTGATHLPEVKQGDTEQETLDNLIVHLIILRAPLFAGALEKTWTAEDEPRSKMVASKIRTKAGRARLKNLDHDIALMVKSEVFTRIQDAVAKALFSKAFLSEEEVKAAVASVYPRTQRAVSTTKGEQSKITRVAAKPVQVQVDLGAKDAINTGEVYAALRDADLSEEAKKAIAEGVAKREKQLSEKLTAEKTIRDYADNWLRFAHKVLKLCDLNAQRRADIAEEELAKAKKEIRRLKPAGPILPRSREGEKMDTELHIAQEFQRLVEESRARKATSQEAIDQEMRDLKVRISKMGL